MKNLAFFFPTIKRFAITVFYGSPIFRHHFLWQWVGILLQASWLWNLSCHSTTTNHITITETPFITVFSLFEKAATLISNNPYVTWLRHIMPLNQIWTTKTTYYAGWKSNLYEPKTTNQQDSFLKNSWLCLYCFVHSRTSLQVCYFAVHTYTNSPLFYTTACTKNN